MEITYCDPQIPLFLPPSVNLVNKKSTEKQANPNTTVKITNSYKFSK